MSRILLFLLLSLSGCASSPTPEELAAFHESASAPTGYDSDLLDLFATSDEAQYTLGQGDLIHVEIWGHPELSGPHVIGPDGRITMPTSGPMACAGLTRSEAAAAITEALDELYMNVSVTVRVDEYRSASVAILGSVMAPGAYPFTTPPTLLRAIANAGGLAEVSTGLRSSRASIVRGSDQVAWIDLDELLRHGNNRLNVTLRRDDIVYIQDSTESTISIIGEVRRPGVYQHRRGMGLLDALASAGGPTVDSQPEQLLVIRPSEGTQIEIDFEEYLEGRYELDVSLRAGDVLFVPRSGIANFGYVLSQVSPFSTVVVAGSNSNSN